MELQAYNLAISAASGVQTRRARKDFCVQRGDTANEESLMPQQLDPHRNRPDRPDRPTVDPDCFLNSREEGYSYTHAMVITPPPLVCVRRSFQLLQSENPPSYYRRPLFHLLRDPKAKQRFQTSGNLILLSQRNQGRNRRFVLFRERLATNRRLM
jgi:hypothetical protein